MEAQSSQAPGSCRPGGTFTQWLGSLAHLLAGAHRAKASKVVDEPCGEDKRAADLRPCSRARPSTFHLAAQSLFDTLPSCSRAVQCIVWLMHSLTPCTALPFRRLLTAVGQPTAFLGCTVACSMTCRRDTSGFLVPSMKPVRGAPACEAPTGSDSTHQTSVKAHNGTALRPWRVFSHRSGRGRRCRNRPSWSRRRLVP